MGRPGCDWGGGVVPASASQHTIQIRPWMFAPNPAWGQNNPATIEIWQLSAAWFSPCIKFPQSTLGGSWVQSASLTPSLADPAVNPSFTVFWCTDVVAGGNVRFDIHYTCTPDGVAMAGGGPGAAILDSTAGANVMQQAPETQIAATGGGAWGGDQVINVNLYRGVPAAGDIVGPVYVMGVRLRYSVV